MEILSTRRLTDQPWLNLFVRAYRRHGVDRNWVFASRRLDPPVPSHGHDGVLIVPLIETPEPRLVMIREYRVPLGGVEVGFPAGITDPGEDIETTVRRELLEETGHELLEILKLSPATYSSSGMSDEAVLMAFVRASPEARARPAPEETEVIETFTVNHEEMRALLASGARFNGRAWPILFLFDQLGRIAIRP